MITHTGSSIPNVMIMATKETISLSRTTASKSKNQIKTLVRPDRPQQWSTLFKRWMKWVGALHLARVINRPHHWRKNKLSMTRGCASSAIKRDTYRSCARTIMSRSGNPIITIHSSIREVRILIRDNSTVDHSINHLTIDMITITTVIIISNSSNNCSNTI